MKASEAAPPRSQGRPAPALPDPKHRHPVRPGDRLAHYEILSTIGAGGMGVVYRARDLALERDVALKCPWPQLAAEPAVRARFLREARAAASLAHPNIVPVFEILEWHGLPWVAMELVEGKSLTALLRGGEPMPVGQALACAEGIAAALETAHAHRILHRDVTPNNVLIRDDGWPLLTDFGLAHGLAEEGRLSLATTVDGSLTQPGQVLGTLPYMSPEQALGRPLDARSDLFSFGAVLYEMCTGCRAFGSSAELGALDAVLHATPRPVRELNPGIPPELGSIIERALAKAPAARWQSASELRAALGALRRRIESGTVGRSPPEASRRPFRLAGIVLAAAAVAGTTWLGLGARRSPGVLPVGTPLQLTSERGWEADPAISPDERSVVYTADTAGNPDIWLSDVEGGPPLQLTSESAVDESPAWFPDGASLAFVSDRGGEKGIWKVPRLGGPPILLVPNAVDPAVSPEGRRIAFARTDLSGSFRIHVAELGDIGKSDVLTGAGEGEGDHRHPAWSPDGRTLCYADGRDLWRVAPEGGPAQRLTASHAGDREPVWSADGRWVVFSSYRGGTLALWRVPSAGGAAERLTVGSGPEVGPAVSRDGSKLLYSTFVDDFDVAVIDRVSGERTVLRGPVDEVAPTLAPDGARLVYASSGRGAGACLWLQSLAGLRPSQSRRPLTQLPGLVNTPAFSPDGLWVAFKRELDGRRDIWVLPAQGGVPSRFSDGAGEDLHPGWSPDGRSLVFVSVRGADQHLWIAPVSEGRRAGPARRLTSGAGSDFLPVWSWDGRHIAFVRCEDALCSLQVAPASGAEAPLRLAASAQMGRVRWEKATGQIWFAAMPEGDRVRLYRIGLEGGAPIEAEGILPVETAAPGEFDLSADARLVAVTVRESRGDVWLLEAEAGTY